MTLRALAAKVRELPHADVRGTDLAAPGEGEAMFVDADEWADVVERDDVLRLIEQAAAPDGLDGLGEAWAEAAEAAKARFGEPRYIAAAGPEPWHGTPAYRAECGMDFAVRGQPTLTAALKELAARLAATPSHPATSETVE